jgi:hypothetical protein
MINKGNFAQFKGWQSLIVMAIVMVLLFVIARVFLKILYFVAPLLIIATAIINYKVILGYFKNIGKLFKRSPLLGVGAGVLSAVFYPVVTAFLFVQALLYRKVDKIQQEQAGPQIGEYVEYEEVDTHEVEAEDLLEEFNRRSQEADEDLDYWDLLNDNEKPVR